MQCIFQDLQKELEAMKANNESLAHSMENRMGQLQDCLEQLESAKAALEEVNAKYSTKSDELNILLQEKQALENLNAKLENDLGAEKGTLEERELTIQQLQTQIKELCCKELDPTSLQLQVSELTTALATKEEEIKKVYEQKQQLEARITVLDETIAANTIKSNRDLSMLQQEVAEYAETKCHLKNIMEDIHSLTNEIVKCSVSEGHELDLKNDDIRTLAGACNKLKLQLCEARAATEKYAIENRECMDLMRPVLGETNLELNISGNDVTNKLKVLLEKYLETQQNVRDINSKLSDSTKQLESKSKEFEESCRELTNAREKLESKCKEMEVLKSQFEKIRDELEAQHQHKLQNYESQLKEIQMIATEYENDLGTSERNIQQLNGEVEKLKLQLTASEEKISELKVAVVKEDSCLISDADDKECEVCLKLRQDIAQSNNVISEYQDSIELLKSQCKTAEIKLANLKEQHQELLVSREKDGAVHAEAQQKIEAMSTTLQKTEAMVDNLKDEVKKTKLENSEEILKKEALLDSVTKEKEKVIQELTSAKLLNQNMLERCSELEGKLQTIEPVLHEAQVELKNCQMKLERKDLQLSEAETLLNAREGEILSTKEQLKQLQSLLHDCDKLYHSWGTEERLHKIKTLVAIYETLTSETFDQRAAKYQALEDEMQELEEQLVQRDSSLKSLSETLAMRDTECQSLCTKLEATVEKLKSEQEKYELQVKELTSTAEAFQVKEEEHKKLISCLQSKVVDHKQEYENLNRIKETLEAKLQDTLTQLEQ